MVPFIGNLPWVGPIFRTKNEKIVRDEIIVLKPFLETSTFRNVSATRTAVVNVTDDAMLFAQGAISRPQFPWVPATVKRPAWYSMSPALASSATSKRRAYDSERAFQKRSTRQVFLFCTAL
jgi:hypothetical protein